MSHHYAIVAAKLVEQCLEQIQNVIDSDERSNRPHPSNSALYDMKVALTETEAHLLCYFSCIIEKEVEKSMSENVRESYEQIANNPGIDLRSSVEFLQFVLHERSSAAAEHAGHPAHSYYPRRSATDSLLFRLNVALQLCLIRIDDARFVITGNRHNTNRRFAMTAVQPQHPFIYYATAGSFGATSLVALYLRRNPELKVARDLNIYQPFVQKSSIVLFSIFTLQWLHKKWSNIWMTTKLVKSTEEIEEWIRQWTLVQSTPTPKLQQQKVLSPPQQQSDKNQDNLLDAARSQRLIEYALHDTVKV
jgi:hypothetical protein